MKQSQTKMFSKEQIYKGKFTRTIYYSDKHSYAPSSLVDMEKQYIINTGIIQ